MFSFIVRFHEDLLETEVKCTTALYRSFLFSFSARVASIVNKLDLPLKSKVYEEYLITDGITLVGSVGGTLGLFIGFSISNFVYSIMNFFQSPIETQFPKK